MPATIDDLPPEMVCELFKHLQPKDLAACSKVNKSWHSIYAGFKLDRLFAVPSIFFSYLLKWCYQDQIIEENELCDMENFSRLVDQPLLSNLKHLALFEYVSESDLNKLNKFSQLVYLEIWGYFRVPGVNKKEVILNLPKLKVLARGCFSRWDPLSIDCPQLSVLLYRGQLRQNESPLVLKQPETIRMLDTGMSNPKLDPFKNVECLITQEIEAISKATLLSLPRMKELHYNVGIEGAFRKFKDETGPLNRMKRTLSEFLDDVNALRGPDFRFRFAGFQLTKTMLDELDFGVQINEYGEEHLSDDYVYLKNYHLIEPGALDFITVLNYTGLMSNVPGEFPICFSKKFTRVKEVIFYTDEIKDEKHLLWFLKSLRALRSLVLDCSYLSQEFYNQLPASANSLVILKLAENVEMQLSLDFIGKFSCLSILRVYYLLALEQFTTLVRHSSKLAEVFCYFRLKEKRFCLQKKRASKRFEISAIPYQLLFETEKLGEIFNYFKRLQADFPKTSI